MMTTKKNMCCDTDDVLGGMQNWCAATSRGHLQSECKFYGKLATGSCYWRDRSAMCTNPLAIEDKDLTNALEKI